MNSVTFQFTCALNAISDPPGTAAALEAPHCVGAHSMSATVVGSDLTFIDIWKIDNPAF